MPKNREWDTATDQRIIFKIEKNKQIHKTSKLLQNLSRLVMALKPGFKLNAQPKSKNCKLNHFAFSII